MKKLIISIALLCTTIYARSQSRLGYTSSEIFSDIGSRYKLDIDFDKDGDKILNCQIGQAYVSYCFFDKSTTCNAVAITPTTQGTLNYFVEQYNKNYVIIDSMNWRMYSNDGTISAISLVNNNNGKAYFLWVNATVSN